MNTYNIEYDAQSEIRANLLPMQMFDLIRQQAPAHNHCYDQEINEWLTSGQLLY